MDSGIGLLPYALAVRRALPDQSLVLSLDSQYMPWGSLPRAALRERLNLALDLLIDLGCSTVVVACNTASVHGLRDLRRRAENAAAVVGTVPPIRPAVAGGCEPVAVWATPATVGSAYLQRLIADVGARRVSQVACHDLAAAIEAGDRDRIDLAIAQGAANTPVDAKSIVLGCTHYSLVRKGIEQALPGKAVFESVDGVVRQVVRVSSLEPAAQGIATRIFQSGREAPLPDVASQFLQIAELLAPPTTS
jgi:glutamate racemase